MQPFLVLSVLVCGKKPFIQCGFGRGLAIIIGAGMVAIAKALC